MAAGCVRLQRHIGHSASATVRGVHHAFGLAVCSSIQQVAHSADNECPKGRNGTRTLPIVAFHGDTSRTRINLVQGKGGETCCRPGGDANECPTLLGAGMCGCHAFPRIFFQRDGGLLLVAAACTAWPTNERSPRCMLRRYHTLVELHLILINSEEPQSVYSRYSQSHV